jgi:hypothetical protein
MIELDDFLDSAGQILPIFGQEAPEEVVISVGSTPSSVKAEEQEVVEEVHTGVWASFTKYLGVPQD